MSFALFTEEQQVLPAFCKPYADELTSSWLTRVAFSHGLNTRELCKYILPYYHQNRLDIDRVFCNRQIKVLAEKTNCSISEVHATTLHSYTSNLITCPNITYEREGWLLPSKFICYADNKETRRHHSGLMFCPGCLQQKVYFKKQWRLAISFACVDCGCYLVDCCPYCEKGSSLLDVEETDFSTLTLNEYLLNCHHCGNDVSRAAIHPVPTDLLLLQKKLYGIMDHGTGDDQITGVDYLRVILYLTFLLMAGIKKMCPLKRLAADVFEINGMSYHDLTLDRQQLRLLPVKERGQLISAAWWLLQYWPQRFLKLCIKHQINRSSILPHIRKAPFWFLEPIYCGLEPQAREKNAERPTVDHSEYTARIKEERIKTVDYDFEIDELYDEEELYYCAL